MKKMMRIIPILCFILIAIVPRTASTQEPGANDRSEVVAHMHEHLTRITTIKAHIIMGKLDGLREPATWLAQHDSVNGLPTNFEPYIEVMRNYARRVVNAPDLNAAAASVSDMAETCGNCHLVNEIQLEFRFDQMPAEWADTVTHMQRHQWAADRLWEGLIGPSDVAWSRGIDMLVDVPLHASDVVDEWTEGTDTAMFDEIANDLHELGAQGAAARSSNARGKLYGEILSLCAACHTKLGRGPGR